MTTTEAEQINVENTHSYGFAQSEGMPPDTGRVLRILWYRKWHILACAFFFGLTAFVLTARQPQMFPAETRILLDPRKVNVVTTSDPIVSDLDFTNATVESEIARIASFAAVAEVVRKLGPEQLKFLDPGDQKSTGLIGLVDWVKTRLSPTLVLGDDLISTDQRKLLRVTNVIARGTKAYRHSNSFVIGLRVTTRDPALSTQIANGLTQFYVAQQLEERRSIARTATNWHESQLVERRSKMAEAENRVESLRRKNITDLGGDAEILALQLVEVAGSHSKARSDALISKARVDSLEEKLTGTGYRAFAEAQGTEPFVGLFAREQKLSSEAQNLAMEFGERHPDRVAIAQELERMDLLIKAAVDHFFFALRSDVSIMASLEQVLKQEVQELQNAIVDAKAATQQLRLSEIEATAARVSYETMVGQLAEIHAQADIQMSDARILSLAQVPTGPSAPRPKFMGFLAGSIGATFGLFTVLIFEALARGISSREELQHLTSAEAICVLPREDFGKAAGILARLNKAQFEPISERLRQLKLVLTHMAKEEGKIILVTSAIPSEGRSTVALSLAALNARSDQRTLLVTSDKEAALAVENSEVHKEEVSGSVPKGGQTQVFDWADISDTGTENSKVSLHSEMAEWRTLYDVIVVDGPPLMAHSQSLVLAQVADQTVFVVDYLRTSKRAISHSLNLLRNIAVFPTAYVLNKSDKRLDPDIHADQT